MERSLAMKLAIGADHHGVPFRKMIKQVLKQRGHTVRDFGSDTTGAVDYPDYALSVARSVASGESERGILICSTGIGMSIAANKIRGVRASLCTSHYMAMMTRQHNDSNVLCLGGKVAGVFEILDIVDAWLDNGYVGGRHAISLGLIADMEAELGLGVPEE